MATLDQSFTTGASDTLDVYTNRRGAMRHTAGLAGTTGQLGNYFLKTVKE